MEKKYELELKRIFFLVYKKKKKIFSNIKFPNFEGKTVVRFIHFRRLFSTRTGRKTGEISTPEKQRLQNKATMWGPNFEEIMIIIILINITVRLFVSSVFFSEISPEGRSGLSTRRNCLGRTVGGGRWRDPRYISSLNFGRTIGDGQRQQLTCR